MTAKEILESLHKTPRQNPLLLAQNLKMNEQVVRNTLTTLLELSLVQTPVRGLYEITKLGELVIRRK